MSALQASLLFRASLSPPIFRPSKRSSVLLSGAFRRLDVNGGLFFSPLPKSLSRRRLAFVPLALPRENADSAREPFLSGQDSFLDSDSPQGSDRLQETSEEASRGVAEAVLEVGVVGDRQELESGRQVVEKNEKRNRLPLVAFLFGAMASLRRVFDVVMMSEWLSWWPFWRQEKRLERLIAEADANPRDAAKQSALLAELNKHSPESVIRRFEQRNHAVDSKGVAEYLRALVVTNTLAEYLPDEQSGKPSSLPTLLQELKQRASENQDEPFLNPGISEKHPLHVVMVDPKASSKSTRFAQELLSTILFTVVVGLMWVMGAAALQKYVGSLGGIGTSGVGSSATYAPKELNKEIMPEKNVKTFKDVKGCDDAKQELEEVVEYLKNPAKFTRLGGKLPKGILLTGAPGTGKTLLAKAIAGEAGVPFFYRAGSEFEEMFVGVGARRVRSLFQAAKKKAPCIIFIDEIDAVGSTRKQWEGHTKKTLHQLLVEMDGFEQNEGIILMAATNLPDILDPALTRPGRFDRHIVVPNPDVRGRQEILELYLEDKPLAASPPRYRSSSHRPPLFSSPLASLFSLLAAAAHPPPPPRSRKPETDARGGGEWRVRQGSGDGGWWMEYEGTGVQMHGTRPPAAVTEGSSSLDEETMWQMNLRGSESMESGPYPERPGEPDCAYYIRTGICRFGMTCKFNHPPNRKLAIIAAARIKGGYPERVGQPECQYYLKTGTCKFGATCKFHHPKDKAGIAGRVQLNILGYPLRPNEKECAYYLRTGQCKFGNTCKFHHPQPSNAMVGLRGSPVYPPAVHSPTTPGQQSYPGGLTNWSLSRTSFIPSPRWQDPSSYAQLILPQGLVQVPGWNPYPGQMGSSSPDSQQQTPGAAQFYSTSRQSETSAGAQGTFSSYRPGSIPMGVYALQRENIFPERPDQPECQFYMKTGDCKFGAVCKFHHPRERLVPVPNCLLSPMGLPLRPGEPLCVFYSRYGICKFGPNCKFDHPMGTFTYGISTPSTTDVPTVRRLIGSSSGPPALTSSSEGPSDGGMGKSRDSRRLSLSESRQIGTGDENMEAEASHTSSSIGQVSSFS